MVETLTALSLLNTKFYLVFFPPHLNNLLVIVTPPFGIIGLGLPVILF